MSKRELESVVCGRCGGSGQYSFNMIHGSKCYGCNGLGRKLSKRGDAAQVYLENLRMIAVEDLKVGDMIRELVGVHGGMAFYLVQEINCVPANKWYPNDPGNVFEIKLFNKIIGSCSAVKFPGYKVRKGFSKDEKVAQLKLALDYQDSLSKEGKPLKRKETVK